MPTDYTLLTDPSVSDVPEAILQETTLRPVAWTLPDIQQEWNADRGWSWKPLVIPGLSQNGMWQGTSGKREDSSIVLDCEPPEVLSVTFTTGFSFNEQHGQIAANTALIPYQMSQLTGVKYKEVHDWFDTCLVQALQTGDPSAYSTTTLETRGYIFTFSKVGGITGGAIMIEVRPGK